MFHSKNIVLLLFFRCSTAQRLKTLKTGLKVSEALLFCSKCSDNYQSRSQIILFYVPILGELSYPRLRVLLQFDTQEFLNVLSMVSNMFVANSLKRFFSHVSELTVQSMSLTFYPTGLQHFLPLNRLLQNRNHLITCSSW